MIVAAHGGNVRLQALLYQGASRLERDVPTGELRSQPRIQSVGKAPSAGQPTDIIAL